MEKTEKKGRKGRQTLSANFLNSEKGEKQKRWRKEISGRKFEEVGRKWGGKRQRKGSIIKAQ